MLTYTPPAKMILILSAGDGNQKRGGIPSWTFPRGTGGHTGPPVCEHRSVQQPQTGRDEARPLQGPEQDGGGVRLGGSGVWSPRPTEATLAVHSGRAAESSAPTEGLPKF